MRSKWIPASLILGLAGIVLAANQETFKADSRVVVGYNLDRQTSQYREVAAVDTTGIAAIRSLGAFHVNGRKNVSVSVRTEAAASAVTFRVYAFYGDVLLGQSVDVTVTSTEAQDDNLLFIAPTYVSDSFGADIIRVVVTDADNGPLRLNVGSY